VAFSGSGDRVVKVEVKTTSSEDKWVIGNKVPEPSESPWVFVRIPAGSDHPLFFVLTQAEIHQILGPAAQEYRRRYRETHGEEFKGPGVEKLRHEQVRSHINSWEKIVDRLRTA
jgi:hypothetical protein